MIKFIIDFWQGYLLISIRGNALERFISQIIGSGIQLWALTRIEKDHYQAKIDIEDFKRLRPLVRKRLCRVRIIKKCGMPFLISKMRSRYFLLLGVLVFLAVFWLASSFLWFINIEGLEQIKEAEISRILTNIGITPGTYKGAIDLDSVEQTLLKKEPLITWVDLTWQGTKLNVEIVEKKMVDKRKPLTISAARDGVIKELIVLKGKPVVREGDTVTRGQTLIVPQTEEGEARGIIRAHVWYEGYGETAIIARRPLTTGRYKIIPAIKYNDRIYRILKKPDFNSYILQKTEKSLPQWRNFNFPFAFIMEKYREVEYLEEKRDRDVALFIARERALDQILNKISAEAVIQESRVKEIPVADDNRVQVRILLKVEEDIGEPLSN